MRIAIVTLWTEQIKDFAQYTEAINKAYAEKHGILFLNVSPYSKQRQLTALVKTGKSGLLRG